VGWAGDDCTACAAGYYGRYCDPCPHASHPLHTPPSPLTHGGGLITNPTTEPCGGTQHGTCNDGHGGHTGNGTCTCNAQTGWEGKDCTVCGSRWAGKDCDECTSRSVCVCVCLFQLLEYHMVY
jgi:hypothetical protein